MSEPAPSSPSPRRRGVNPAAIVGAFAAFGCLGVSMVGVIAAVVIWMRVPRPKPSPRPVPQTVRPNAEPVQVPSVPEYNPLNWLAPAQVGRFTRRKTEKQQQAMPWGATGELRAEYGTPASSTVQLEIAFFPTSAQADRYFEQSVRSLAGNEVRRVFSRDDAGQPVPCAMYDSPFGPVTVWARGNNTFRVTGWNRADGEEFVRQFANGPKLEGPVWRSNVYAAFEEAVTAGKPMVVYFYQQDGSFCEQLENEVFAWGALSEYADQAVFVRVDGNSDDAHRNVTKLKSGLDIDRYPVVAILDPTRELIGERGRVTGHYPTAEFGQHFTEAWNKPRHRALPDGAPSLQPPTNSPAGVRL